MKKYEAKITSAYSLILPGHIFAFKNNQNLKKKFNQDCSFSYMNLLSTKLDEISLFGIFDGNGPFGKGIALGFKNYIINYFKKCTEMRVTLKKDNFYSIMYNSFINAQNYLINNSTKLNINMKYSGATGIVVLYPHNNTNKIYCANVGRNKCIFYTMVGALRLSYELFPYRASERFRISLFKQQRKNKLQENDNSINIIDNNINKESTSNNMMVNNNMENLYTNNDTETRILNEREKENFLREFNELDISRCIGNLAAEEFGVIPGPEIVESDIRLNKGKVLVMGRNSWWNI
jgi:serine/threonine protein phosphatase PrpC